MKSWQKGLLGGVLLGGASALPVFWWLADLKVRFHCPHCDATLAVHKQRGQLAPEIAVQEEPEETPETPSRIAVAPTV